MVYTKMIGNWTVLEWIVWLSLTVLAVVGTYLWTERGKKAVTPQGAKQKVSKSIKKHCEDKDAVIFTDIRLDLGADKIIEVDNLLVGHFGVLLVKTFNRGVVVYGEPRKETWRIIERGFDEEVPNPILTLENDIELIRNNFAKNNIFKVPMQPLAVFAETTIKPQLNLGSLKEAIIYKEIPEYLKGKFFAKAELQNAKEIANYINGLITDKEPTVFYTIKPAEEKTETEQLEESTTQNAVVEEQEAVAVPVENTVAETATEAEEPANEVLETSDLENAEDEPITQTVAEEEPAQELGENEEKE